MIEVDVHQHLREFLREQGEPHWPHHLTIARLVARALRLQRSALIQLGAAATYAGKHRLSYLVPLLISPQPVLLVTPTTLQQRLLRVDIPRLSASLPVQKPIAAGDRWPENFQGLFLTTPETWLQNHLHQQHRFPSGVPVIIDEAEDLEDWVRQQLTVSLRTSDWEDLMLAYPQSAETIRSARIGLTRSLFQHPANPYHCVLLDTPEQEILRDLEQSLARINSPMPQQWQSFWQQLASPDRLLWVDIDREGGRFTLHAAVVDVAPHLQPIWSAQPVVLVGSSLDLDAAAPLYRQRVGLGELTCLKFAPDRHREVIQLYLPEVMPMPNTPQYQAALLGQIGQLLYTQAATGLTVLIVDDLPLKKQVGSLLAAQFGSRVQVENTVLSENGILVTGWQFWQQYQPFSPPPQLLIVATLPLPSIEDPRVAGRVSYYKRHHQDWFRLYLLPEALSQLERAIAAVRSHAGFVALLDPRVVYRSYGQQVLSVLSPYLRINYLAPELFSLPDCPAGEQY
uniref:Putative ATP-dependent DNA helicase DinG n=1 Tax=Cyanothece sp. (strain PCC 7425 / ATCC 29141) TaxID=395961 RepID=B8HX26_CYAP4